MQKMPSKKVREKESETSKIVVQNNELNEIENNFFIEQFNKPCNIYKLIKHRDMTNKVFMHRTLFYMQHRMSRNHKNRRNFRVDSMLEKVQNNRESHGNLVLTFHGFFDPNIEVNKPMQNGSDTTTRPQNNNDYPRQVMIQVSLLKLCHKKRKGVNPSLTNIPIDTVYVNLNSGELNETITITNDVFSNSSSQNIKAFMLLFEVSVFKSQHVNGEEVPTIKRRKLNQDEKKRFKAELQVYGSNNVRILKDGVYDIIVNEVTNDEVGNNVTKYAKWEDSSILLNTLGCEMAAPPTDFSNHSMLFPKNGDDSNGDKLTSSSLKMIPQLLADFDKYNSTSTIKVTMKWTKPELSGGTHKKVSTRGGGVVDYKKNGGLIISETKNDIFVRYQFLHHSKKQETSLSHTMICPWCHINCHMLYSLLKHLRLCHPRFNITYMPLASDDTNVCIQFTLNEGYDHSYEGPSHLLLWPRIYYTGLKTIRRKSFTIVRTYRHLHNRALAQKSSLSLSEFLQPENNNLDTKGAYGHARTYHHTGTCLAIWPDEMDCDSEAENDPEWLRTKTKMMIDDFTDVNEGEKELMKLWNLHVMKYGFVGDVQIPLACYEFVKHRGKEILMRNLYRNFVLHMTNLFDYGLISPTQFYDVVVRKLHGLEGPPEGAELARINSNAVEQQQAASCKGQGGGNRRKMMGGGAVQEVVCTNNVAKKQIVQQPLQQATPITPLLKD